MLIYSNELTRGNIIAAAPKGTYVAECEIVYGKGDKIVTRRRKRTNCFRVLLSGSNPRHIMGNAGIHAATYDEWGHFLADIYEQDEQAICGPYSDTHDFHYKTKYAYDREDCWNCDMPDGNHAVGCPAIIGYTEVA